MRAGNGAARGSKKTDYLVCGESSDSELDKATALDVRVISPDELATMLGR